jgi:hypothetical protein
VKLRKNPPWADQDRLTTEGTESTEGNISNGKKQNTQIPWLVVEHRYSLIFKGAFF